MKVILKEEVEGLGFAGDVVEVKPGYGRNYLVPRGLAIPATPAALKQLEQQRAIAARREERLREHFQRLAENLEGKKIVVYKRAGSGSKLYGSVTTQDIAAAIKDQLGLEIERRRLSTGQPIKVLGEHEVVVELARGVQARFVIEVRREGEEEKVAAEEAEQASAQPAEEQPAQEEPAEQGERESDQPAADESAQ